jgi:hypothetical protein
MKFIRMPPESIQWESKKKCWESLFESSRFFCCYFFFENKNVRIFLGGKRNSNKNSNKKKCICDGKQHFSRKLRSFVGCLFHTQKISHTYIHFLPWLRLFSLSCCSTTSLAHSWYIPPVTLHILNIIFRFQFRFSWFLYVEHVRSKIKVKFRDSWPREKIRKKIMKSILIMYRTLARLSGDEEIM